jgi:hypothetical protein
MGSADSRHSRRLFSEGSKPEDTSNYLMERKNMAKLTPGAGGYCGSALAWSAVVGSQSLNRRSAIVHEF